MSDAPYYRAVGREVALFEHAFRLRQPLLLRGPTGCGKSRFVEHMAHRLGRPLVTVACHEDTSATDLLGRFLIQGGDTVWQDGPVTRAVRQGAILYLDELAEARPDVIVALHPLSDHRHQIFVDRLDTSLTAAEGFMLVASYNPGYQNRLKELKPSTRQRFLGVRFDYPSASVEQEIVEAESGVPAAMAKRLVALGHKLRTLDRLGLAEVPSTRLLVETGKLIASGYPAREAAQAAMVEPLTDDAEVIDGLMQAVKLVL
ncbi:MAG: CbbQ/NirQ/NorQ/GpvN family protein [Proteobacteria bacterium]|nr:CbbQ/NirQ/NorQ/GpvN family protein [Pseudomonadota bacterium]